MSFRYGTLRVLGGVFGCTWSLSLFFSFWLWLLCALFFSLFWMIWFFWVRVSHLFFLIHLRPPTIPLSSPPLPPSQRKSQNNSLFFFYKKKQGFLKKRNPPRPPLLPPRHTPHPRQRPHNNALNNCVHGELSRQTRTCPGPFSVPLFSS